MKSGKYFVATLVLVVFLGPLAGRVSAQHKLRATLKGFSETPANSTTGNGTFKASISEDESSITFEITYSDLVADSLFSHIHIGQKNVAGGIMIWFCDSTTPAPNPPRSPRTCPARGGTVTGTVTAADVVGPTGQGISAGEFAKVLQAIRSGVAYVNVHSTEFPGGEIRGQVVVLDDHDKDKDDR